MTPLTAGPTNVVGSLLTRFPQQLPSRIYALHHALCVTATGSTWTPGGNLDVDLTAVPHWYQHGALLPTPDSAAPFNHAPGNIAPAWFGAVTELQAVYDLQTQVGTVAGTPGEDAARHYGGSHAAVRAAVNRAPWRGGPPARMYGGVLHQLVDAADHSPDSDSGAVQVFFAGMVAAVVTDPAAALPVDTDRGRFLRGVHQLCDRVDRRHPGGSATTVEYAAEVLGWLGRAAAGDAPPLPQASPVPPSGRSG